MSNLTQVKLESNNYALKTQMITWLDSNPKIKIGTELTLKKDSRTWRVLEVYDTLDEKKISNYGWDNNNYDKHTGLFK